MPSACQLYRDALYVQLARLTRAMAHPTRLMLLDLLLQAPRTVEALAAQLEISVASTSQHLQVLRGARLVETQKKGLYVTYSLADEAMYEVLHGLRLVAQHRLAEIDQLRRQVGEQSAHLKAVTAEELRDCLDRGEVVVLDVRPPEEYAAGHLPGARNVPLAELPDRLGELPRETPIVAYCRGEYCLMARMAVDLLQKAGFIARYVDEGVRELETAGVPIERG